MYRFTTSLPKRVCRNCFQSFDKKWSDGGVGAICEDCYDIRTNMDLIEAGIIRNIEHIYDKLSQSSFTFEAKIDDEWCACSSPCGNWSYVDKCLKDSNFTFSVPVGYRELERLLQKHHSL